LVQQAALIEGGRGFRAGQQMVQHLVRNMRRLPEVTAGEERLSGGQPGFWDVQERLRELSAQGDPLFRQILAGDCREFRVWLVMMGKKELSHASPQNRITLSTPTPEVSGGVQVFRDSL